MLAVGVNLERQGGLRHAYKKEAGQAVLLGQLLPRGEEIADVGEIQRVVNGEEQPAVHRHVALVLEGLEQSHEMAHVVFMPRIGLLYHHAVLLKGRCAPPCLVAPTVVGPAEAEGEVGLAGGQHLVEGALQQLLAVAEPVVIVAEALNAGLAGQRCLLLAHLRQAQVVEAQVGRDARLVMAAEQRLGLGNISPLGESFSPPFVIFWDGVVLWKI